MAQMAQIAQMPSRPPNPTDSLPELEPLPTVGRPTLVGRGQQSPCIYNKKRYIAAKLQLTKNQ